jgi:hypothetical protein
MLQEETERKNYLEKNLLPQVDQHPTLMKQVQHIK